MKWAAHTATAASGTQRGAKSSSASSLTGLCVAWQRRIGAACTHFHTGDAHQVSGYAQQTFTGASARRLAQRIGLAVHVDVDGISQVSRIGISYGTVSRRHWAESNVLAAGGWRRIPAGGCDRECCRDGESLAQLCSVRSIRCGSGGSACEWTIDPTAAQRAACCYGILLSYLSCRTLHLMRCISCVVCYMLYVVSCMLHAVRRMLHVCRMLRVACCVLHAACCRLGVVCCQMRALMLYWSMLRAVRCS